MFSVCLRCIFAVCTERSVLPCLSQATDGDQHPLLDRAAPQRPLAVAGQGAHTNGLPQHPLLQRVLGKPSSTHFLYTTSPISELTKKTHRLNADENGLARTDK